MSNSGWTKPTRDQWNAWIEKRPEIREAALMYPHGSTFIVEGERFWCIGYVADATKCTGLFLTPIDPNVDYDKALEERATLCLCCAAKFLEKRGIAFDS